MNTLTPVLTCVVAMAASGAQAAVQLFDNTATQFVWIPNGGDFAAGGQFDPTLGPGQQDQFVMSRSLHHTAAIAGGSNGVTAESIIALGTQIRIAHSTVPRTVNGPNQGQETVFDRVAQVFSPGDSVGANRLFDNAGVHVGAFNISLNQIPFLGQHPFLGFRVILADGLPHYGWIEFDRRRVFAANGGEPFCYQPVRWAYETLPNTPIMVVPSPGALGMLALGGMMAARRRRAC